MRNSLIGALRGRHLALRIVCAVIIVAFGGLVTAPAVAAVRQGYQAYQADAAAADSVEAHLEKVLEKMRGILEKVSNKTARKANAPEWAELKSLHHTFETLDKRVREKFEHTEAHLKQAHLPDVILQRQVATVSKYRERVNALLSALSTVESTDDDTVARAAVEKAITTLDGAKFKATPQPFDPRNLPFGAPKEKVREPKTTPATLKAELTPSSNEATTLAMTAATSFAADDPANPAYLSQTPDIQLTEAIKAKAAELGHDPVNIYNWVHNNVEYIPSYGSIQGADQTLRTLRGNDFDTASLLIALLRASNIPARYVYGTVKMPIDKVMNWIGGVSNPQAALQLLGQGGIPNTGLTQGGVITAVRLEHVWVEAWVDFYPSRGARNLKGDAWVPLDASFKQYIYKAGMNIQQQVPFDTQAFTQHLTETATINRDEGSIRGMDPAYIQNQLATYQQQVKDFIDNQNPDATVGDVLGAKTIISLSVPTLAAGLPYSLVAVGDRWATLPDNLRWKFTFELEDDYGNPVVSYTAAAPVLAGKDFSLSFKPATDADAQTIASYFPHVPDGGTIGPSQLPPSLPGYLIHLMPEISVDGQSVASQGSFELGSGLRAQEGYWSPRDGWQIKTNELIVGEYQAIGLDLQGIPQERLAALKAQLADTQAKLESGDVSALTGHNLTGAILQAGVLAYFAINNAQDILAARSNSMVQYPEPSFGTFKTTVQTTYNFGIPQSVGILGVTMDIDWYKTSSVSKDASSEKKRTYYLTIGPRLSAFEHIVPEQLFSTADQPVEGISAVKALAIAATQGQKIYRVSQTNLTTALPQLTISQDIKDEIQNAVNAGQEVTVSRGPISYAGWHGTGYIIQDPQTGAGAYKINGGANGSATNKTTGSALNYFGDFLSIIGASQSIASFFAKVGYELRSFKFSDYTTAFKDAGNLLIGVSAVMALFSIKAQTGSLWKGVEASAIDLTLSLIAGFIGDLLFGVLAALPFGGAIAVVAVAIALAAAMTIIENLIFERLFGMTDSYLEEQKVTYV